MNLPDEPVPPSRHAIWPPPCEDMAADEPLAGITWPAGPPADHELNAEDGDMGWWGETTPVGSSDPSPPSLFDVHLTIECPGLTERP
jgi:hypothetical protein